MSVNSFVSSSEMWVGPCACPLMCSCSSSKVAGMNSHMGQERSSGSSASLKVVLASAIHTPDRTACRMCLCAVSLDAKILMQKQHWLVTVMVLYRHLNPCLILICANIARLSPKTALHLFPSSFSCPHSKLHGTPNTSISLTSASSSSKPGGGTALAHSIFLSTLRSILQNYSASFLLLNNLMMSFPTSFTIH
jgi:hypothetical protein